MRCGRTVLIFVGSLAAATPAAASDKLPPKAHPPAEATSPPAPADLSDPSIAPLLLPDLPAPPTPPASPTVPVHQPSVITNPPPVVTSQPLPPVDADKILSAYPFALFFDLDSADLTPGATDVLNSVVEAYNRIGAGHVTLSGYTDSSGRGDYNKELSQRRVAAVKSYLVGKGIAADAISTEALGESKPLVDTADGMHEPQNRRVEITVAAAAGRVSTR